MFGLLCIIKMASWNAFFVDIKLCRFLNNKELNLNQQNSIIDLSFVHWYVNNEINFYQLERKFLQSQVKLVSGKGKRGQCVTWKTTY